MTRSLGKTDLRKTYQFTKCLFHKGSQSVYFQKHWFEKIVWRANEKKKIFVKSNIIVAKSRKKKKKKKTKKKKKKKKQKKKKRNITPFGPCGPQS